MAGKPVLIIEDNPINLKLAHVLLSKEGFVVKVATDAEEALIMLKDFHPRLILMDIQLPGMDGLQLTRLLKQNPETQDIIIVALTAYAMKGDEEKVLNAGCDDYIAKPIDIHILINTINKHLKKN
jgi:two-component system cell cycle response regulator DivK